MMLGTEMSYEKRQCTVAKTGAGGSLLVLPRHAAAPRRRSLPARPILQWDRSKCSRVQVQSR